MENYQLSNEVEIPKIGFGTYKLEDGAQTYEAVTEALKVGYRHVDTAQVYGNEVSVGKAINDSQVARQDIFLTTKLWNTVSTYEEAMTTFQESLDRLQQDYVDLILIHWPNPIHVRDNDAWVTRNAEVWRAMEDLYQAGKVKSIGVSNFRQHHLDKLLETAQVVPMVNQIKLAPGLEEKELVAYCREKGMLLEAYTPLGRGTVLNNETISQLAEKYGKTNVQIALRWSLDKGFLPLPKSATLKNIEPNLHVFDFELDQEDVEVLNDLPGISEFIDPDTVEF